LAPEANALSS